MKKTNDADIPTSSGLFLGSEPLQDVQHRSAAKADRDGTDSPLGDKADDDSTDSDKVDTDTVDTDQTDKGDTGDSDTDGKD